MSIRSSGVPHLRKRSREGLGDHLGVGDEWIVIQAAEDRLPFSRAAIGDLTEVVVVILLPQTLFSTTIETQTFPYKGIAEDF